MKKTEEEKQEIVTRLCNTLTEEKLDDLDLVLVMSHLLFSIGASLEECSELTSEKVLTMYASKPTLGSALMAQAMHMKETWSNTERNEDDRETKDL